MPRRATILLGCLVACSPRTTGSAPAPPVGDAAAPRALDPGPAPLAAGLYFRYFQYKTCPACPTPRAAVVLGVYPTAAEAAQALRGAPADRLVPGYPMAAHTDEVGLVDDTPGVALIAGLFASAADASSFLAAHAELGGARVSALLDDDALQRRREARYGQSEQTAPLVVRLSSDHVAAFAPAGFDPPADEPPRELRELCRLGRDAVFLASGSTSSYYTWAPVTCGDRPAYVPWLDTLIGASIAPTGDGTYRLTQVTSVSEDQPSLGRWTFDRAGRGDPLPAGRPRPRPRPR